MKTNSLNIDSSVEWLNAGKILIHPTESIWGLGCDAMNEKAVNLIFKIKKRDKKKSFILLIDSLISFEKYLQDIDDKDRFYLDEHWPGPYTFLVKYNDNLPSHLKNETGKIAIRVSNHLPMKNLLEAYKGFMVSTSANFSGQSNINCPNKILETFANDDIAYYDESLGEQSKPSQIIDLETGIIIRE